MFDRSCHDSTPGEAECGRPRWKLGCPLLAATVVFGLGLAGCSSSVPPAATPAPSPTAQPAPTTAEEASPQLLAQGARLYAANCQVCHGDREGQGASGGAPPHNDTGHTWHHPDAQLKDWVLNGKFLGAMPPFKDVLAEEEIDAILAYVKTWWTAEQRESQADISRRYQEALEKQNRGQ